METMISVKLSDLADLADIVCDMDYDHADRNLRQMLIKKLHAQIEKTAAENAHLIYQPDDEAA